MMLNEAEARAYELGRSDERLLWRDRVDALRRACLAAASTPEISHDAFPDVLALIEAALAASE